MSDIAPKAIAAPSGVMPALPSTAAPAANNTATAAEIPAAVANLSVGTMVSGTVIERSPRGLVVLRTDKGTIKLQTPVPLKQGSTVTLQIQSVGTQVQLSILSVDGQPVANPTGKALPLQIRAETAVMAPLIDGSPARPQTNQATAPSSHPAIAEDGLDGTLGRQVVGDRLVTDRGVLPRVAAGQTPAPAGSFVARPLVQINSAGLEALSSPAATMPTTASNSASVVAATNTVAPGTVASGAQTVSTLSSGVLPQGAPAATTNPALAGAANITAATTAAVTNPAVITTGTRFVASFVGGPKAAPSAIPEGADLAGRGSVPGSPSIPSPLSAPPMPAAAPTVSPTTLPSDRVILRLLGLAAPPSSGPAGATAAALPANPAIAPGLTVLADAVTTIGTIIEGGDLANLPPSAVAAAHGKALIATPFGLLAAAGPAPGPAGTKLLLEVILRGDLGEPPQPLTTTSGLPLAAPLTASSKTWPVLNDIMAAVRNSSPDIAEHLTNVTLPRIGPNLAAGMMAFVAAVRQGNPRAWLGEQTVESLHRSGHGALIDKLADDFSVVTRSAAETSPHNWQSLMLPLYDGDQLRQIRMYWQRQRRKPDQRKETTRFVVETDLTALGTLQLDGVFSRPQFDLVVRTSTSLPAPIRGDIIEIFSDALLATSLKGAVTFQTNADLRAGPPRSEDEPGIGFIV